MVHGLVAECDDRPAGREAFVSRAPKLSAEDREAQRYAVYERGWVDSLSAYDRRSSQPPEDVYAYAHGWQECAAYRWQDPKNNGRAPDPNFRIPRR